MKQTQLSNEIAESRECADCMRFAAARGEPKLDTDIRPDFQANAAEPHCLPYDRARYSCNIVHDHLALLGR